nr:PREDICTED: uncharacterized protein LOC100881514 [Megachile rotundata]
MQSAILLVLLLSYSGWVNGLCDLENGVIAHCHELEDVKYIETYDLETLKASQAKPVLRPGIFVNLTSLRHLDLSRSGIERIEPGAFRELHNLRSLDLAENNLEQLELGSIDGLHHLHNLNLRKNNLQQLPPVLARLKIKYLDIQGNPLQCNCSTLRVRDLIVKRGVKIMKKVLCAGPGNLKGMSLFKVDTATTCRFEEQDREMQNDQPSVSEEEFGSGDDLGNSEELTSGSSEIPKEVEIETPLPDAPEVSTPSIVQSSFADTSESQQSSSSSEEAATTQMALKKTIDKDEEIYFDSDEKTSTSTAAVERQKVYVDNLFHPEGSGDVEDGSGEGSGTDEVFGTWTKIGEVEKPVENEETSSIGSGLFDMFVNMLWSTTEAPGAANDPDLEEEQFIDVSSAKEVEEEISTQKVTPKETAPPTTEAPKVEIIDNELHDKSKLEKVVEESDVEENDRSAEVALTKQSKKGMGSYFVLGALLAILATLIGFAAYKGDFCRRRRKRGDVEHGTEMKDMQKALLETGNSARPKVASNGNVENVPLFQDATDHGDTKTNDFQTTIDVSKPPSERTEPTKPPRNSQNGQRLKDTADQESASLNDDSLSARISSADPVVDNCPVNESPDVNGPPLSPGAQRVKITLQENPDSVPKTPILITRTMAGENLVKTP